MHQPCSSAGPPAGPRRPAAPKPVLNAARIMYGGAAVSAAELIGALPFMGGIHGKALGHRLTATPLAITVVIVVLLVPVALWLWMARAAGRGRNWARIVSVFSAVPPRPGQDGGVRAASSRRGPSRRRHEDDPGACSAAPGRIWT
jgi:hypothetical protein